MHFNFFCSVALTYFAPSAFHIKTKTTRSITSFFVVVFDEFNLIDEDLINEDLDRELRAAARSHLSETVEEENYDDDDSFGF